MTTIERIILAIPRDDLTLAQRDAVAEAGRVALSAIPGVETVSFGIAAAADEPYAWYVRIRFRDEQARQQFDTHPAHLDFVFQQWVPALKDYSVRDYRLSY